jgi:HlyD family secretion protein
MAKKIMGIAAAALMLAAFIGTMVYLYKQSKPVQEHIETAALQRRDIINKTVATGTIVPDNQVTLRPRVSGIVEEVFVKPGDKIKPGQAVARIRVVPSMAQLNAAQSQVEQARLSFRDAQRNLKRDQELYARSAIAAVQLQNSELAAERAKIDFETAENNLEIIREGASRKGAAEANTTVRSAIGGMVLSVPVERGFSVIESNTFNEGSAIAEIADMSKMVFKGQVDETEVGKIRAGMPLRLTIGAIDYAVFDATLRYISPKGSKEAGAVLFDIEADVALIDSLFVRAGYSASADIVLASADSVLTVEERNIIFEDGRRYIELQKDSLVFEKTEISTGLSDGIYAQILSPLAEPVSVKVQKQ